MPCWCWGSWQDAGEIFSAAVVKACVWLVIDVRVAQDTLAHPRLHAYTTGVKGSKDNGTLCEERVGTRPFCPLFLPLSTSVCSFKIFRHLSLFEFLYPVLFLLSSFLLFFRCFSLCQFSFGLSCFQQHHSPVLMQKGSEWCEVVPSWRARPNITCLLISRPSILLFNIELFHLQSLFIVCFGSTFHSVKTY